MNDNWLNAFVINAVAASPENDDGDDHHDNCGDSNGDDADDDDDDPDRDTCSRLHFLC